MMLRIDSTSSVPVYAQIVEHVKRAIASGALPSGAMLPSRRDLALRLEINPLTVLKAYKQLESEGLIEIRQGLGCFVSADLHQAVDDYRYETLIRHIDDLVNDARDFGVPFDQLHKMVSERIELAENGSESEEGNG